MLGFWLWTSLSCGILSFGFLYLFHVLWLVPEKIRMKLESQGIKGPRPLFFFGNILEMKRIRTFYIDNHVTINADAAARMKHDYALKLFPYFDQWRKDYGPVFTYSTGNIQSLYVSDPDMMKELSLLKNPLDLGKPLHLQRERGPLLGHGILTSNGDVWAHQRKIISPEFFMEKVKIMVNLMVTSTLQLLDTWDESISRHGKENLDIRIDEDLRSLSADVISRACFGSSYIKGKEIFLRLRGLQKAMTKSGLLVGIPGIRYLPTKNNWEIWRLEREIKSLILKVVKERTEDPKAQNGKDFLQTIIEGATDCPPGPDTKETFIVDNCKNIYFAGHETTAVTATWTLVLLASYPEWQVRVRNEVLEILRGEIPNATTLRKMKMLTMVIQETLRLYPPAAFVTRGVFRDIKVGKYHIPSGTTLWIPLPTMHQDPYIWGQDAHEFNPDRFSSGIYGACKFPNAYSPFGLGTRTCLGQNFAMTELKVLLSLILSRFTFALSPTYQHLPAFRLVVEPEHGVNLLLKKL